VKKVFRKKSEIQQSLADVNSAINESHERDELINAFRRANWSASVACKLIGMPRSTFYRKVKHYNIQTPNILDVALNG
jgi:transcriptional regulator of acetoin/glycerol metabolism